jgi:hypothetical protein
MPELRHPWLAGRRAVKIAEGVKLVEACYKAKKLIRVTLEIAFGRITDILISGDFFMKPENALPKLEQSLTDTPLSRVNLIRKVRNFYEDTGIQIPGIMPEDFAEAIMRAAEGSK